MACSVDIRSTYFPGSSPGGQFELIGYSPEETGTYGSGGNWPWQTYNGDNPVVNFDNIIQGWYKLNYFGGTCPGAQERLIPVVGGGLAGTDDTIQVCQDGGIQTLSSLLGTIYDEGVMQADWEWTGTGASSTGFVPGNSPLESTFNPAGLTGTFTFTLTITPVAPTGYPLNSGCSNCTETVATLTIEIIELQATISHNGCQIELDSISGCTGITYELMKWNGTWWAGTGVTALPHTVTVDGDYRLDLAGCGCTGVSNEITINEECQCTGTLTISQNGCNLQADTDPCTDYYSVKWYKWNGVSWQTVPGGSYINWPYIEDLIDATNGDYRLRVQCDNSSGCVYYSNVITVTGCASTTCTADTAISLIGCTLELGVTDCDTYTSIDWYKNGSTLVQSGQSKTYVVTSNGDYHAEVVGCPNCTSPVVSSSIYVATCGTGCGAYVSISKTGCTLTATVSGCGTTPSYQWYLDGVLMPGETGQTVIVEQNGDYKVKVTGCTNCSDVWSSVETVSDCECVTSAWIVQSGCTLTLYVSGCTGYTKQWFKNGVLMPGETGQTLNVVEDNDYYCEVYGCTECGDIQTGTITVTGCETPDCTCSANITYDSSLCRLTLNKTGCTGFSWVWKRGTQTVQQGGDTYDPTVNDYHHVVLSKSGCSDITTNSVSVGCVSATCNCGITISLNPSTCEVTAIDTNCTGYLNSFWFKPIGGSWVNTGVTGLTYSPTEDGWVERRGTKVGCSDVVSNTLYIDCTGCQVIITSIAVHPTDCNKVRVQWSGASGSGVTVQWSYPSVNVADCPNSMGWTVCQNNGTAFVESNPDGTGYSDVIVASGECDKCIRAVVDASNNGCAIASDRVLSPCCCDGTPSIAESPETRTYSGVFYNPINGIENELGFGYGNTGDGFNYRHGMKVKDNFGNIIGTVTKDNTMSNSSDCKGNSFNDGSGGGVLKVTAQSTIDFIWINNIKYDITNTAYHTGVIVADLTFNGNADAATVTAYCNVITNIISIELTGVGGTDFLLNVSFSSANGSLTISFTTRHNKLTWHGFEKYGLNGVELADTTILMIDNTSTIAGGMNTDTLSYSICGGNVQLRYSNNPITSFVNSNSDKTKLERNKMDTVMTAVGMTVNPSDISTDNEVICSGHKLEVISACSSATYLWSTGDTTSSIFVSPGNATGTFTCEVTCPDGCVYNLSYTF